MVLLKNLVMSEESYLFDFKLKKPNKPAPSGKKNPTFKYQVVEPPRSQSAIVSVPKNKFRVYKLYHALNTSLPLWAIRKTIGPAIVISAPRNASALIAFAPPANKRTAPTMTKMPVIKYMLSSGMISYDDPFHL